MGYPHSWMVYFMENPMNKMDENWGYPYDSGNPHMGEPLGELLTRLLTRMSLQISVDLPEEMDNWRALHLVDPGTQIRIHMLDSLFH